MDKTEILIKLTEILRDEFDDDTLQISYDTTAADVEGWDSLAHLSIVHSVEEEFGIRLTLAEILDAESVGEFIDYIQRHLESGR